MSNRTADKVIDARALAPPEPFVLTMEALEVLGPEEKLLLILNREPHPLYRALERDGYAHQAERTADGTVHILIWRNPT